MEAYTDFAAVYDLFMEETPYQEWKERIVELLKEHGIHDGLVLDLGCGTGTMTELLGREGYDMIGVDASCDMLDVAVKKRESSGLDILYLCQDMRELELYGTVRAVVCICDGLNYLLDREGSPRSQGCHPRNRREYARQHRRLRHIHPWRQE